MTAKRSPAAWEAGWWSAGLLIVLVLPTELWLRQPLWAVGPEKIPGFLGLGAAYVLATVVALALSHRVRARPLAALLGVVVGFGMAYGVMVHGLGLALSRGVSALASGISLGLIAAGLRLPDRARGLASLGLLAAAAVVIAWGWEPAHAPEAHRTVVHYAAYHRVRIDYNEDVVREVDGRFGGGLRKIGNEYVRMTGSGTFFRIDVAGDGSEVAADSLPIPSPLNTAAFDSAGMPGAATFRALDLIGMESGDGVRLIVSHLAFRPEASCFVLRVSSMDLDARLQPREGGSAAWRALYDTRPCLPVVERWRRTPGIQNESGGRLEWLEPGRLLVTVGDYGYDGVNHAFIASQADTSDYGRTLVLDVETGAVETFTKGQRNPQGLHVDEDGRVWATEHGPQGGDELNLLIRGRNYGWPYQTYGTDYGQQVWPLLGSVQGDFEPPAYSWVPSIGVSEVMTVPDGAFTRWDGDLLVASMRAGTVYRIDLDGGRVAYVEPLPIGRRIRDMAPGPDGSVLLWTDGGDLVTLSAMPAADRGEALFGQCATCHLTDGLPGGLAPGLAGVVGREVASVPGFEYSPALRRLGGVWTVERLDQFLQDPARFAPGTAMAGQSIADAEDRAALIRYLTELVE